LPARAPPPASPVPANDTGDRIAIRDAGRTVLVPLAEIDWIEAADYYVQLHVGAKSYLHREPMRDLEARLDAGRFVRIHRSTIVAIDRVVELRPSAHGDHCVRLRDGTDLKLSRARRTRLRQLLESRTPRS
jgi:two-component system LytT family response regulator